MDEESLCDSLIIWVSTADLVTNHFCVYVSCQQFVIYVHLSLNILTLRRFSIHIFFDLTFLTAFVF